MKSVLLVADRFAAMIDRPDVIGVSAFLDDVRSGRHDAAAEPCRLVVGQGLGRQGRAAIAREVDLRGLSDRFTLSGRDFDAVPHRLVHKERPENVLLADVQRLGPDRFQACLTIGEYNELILDHVSGCHISGMVMKEAARQMILAVTESFYVTDREGPPRKYLLRSWSTEFALFLFPVAATVVYTVDRLDVRRPGRLSFAVQVEIMQQDRCAARCAIEFLTCDGAIFTGIERRQADRVIDTVLQAPEAALL